jgi:hypothetical protein
MSLEIKQQSDININAKQKMKEYYQTNKEHLKNKAKINRAKKNALYNDNKLPIPTLKNKKCNVCKILLPIDKFSYRKNRGCHESKCKKCRCDEGKKYTQDNRLQISSIRKVKHANRKKNDPLYSITQTLRSRLHKVLERKTIKTSKLIGAPNGILMKWFEFNLQLDQSTDMTLDNRGKFWHIDHVIPCNKFNLLENKEQLICMNWTNLKPMLAHKNIAKHDNIIYIQCIEHEIRLKLFGKENNIKIGDSTLKTWVQSGGDLTTAVGEKSLMQQQV